MKLFNQKNVNTNLITYYLKRISKCILKLNVALFNNFVLHNYILYVTIDNINNNE